MGDVGARHLARRGRRRGPATRKGSSFPAAAEKKHAWSAEPPVRRLWIGTVGVAIDDPMGRRLVCVPWTDCLALIHDTPTVRTLLGRDGSFLTIDAAAWQRGSEAVSALDRLVPTDRVAPPHG